MAKPKTPLSTRIREFQETHPFTSAKDVAAKIKTTTGYVYAIRNKDKIDSGWKTVSMSTSKKPLSHSITMMEDDVTKLTDEQLERMAANLGRPRMRMQTSAPADNVNHPEHYKAGGIETIDFIEAKGLNYHLGNVVKYISRADHKGDRKENLLKAQWYLNREVAKYE